MSRLLAIIAALLGLSLLTGCGDGPTLRITDAEVRVSPVEGNPAVGYFTIVGGPEDVSLRNVVSDSAVRIELHETMEMDGMSTMQALKEVPVPAGETVKFEPGGKHIMIWGVPQSAVTLNELPIVFVFSNGDRIMFEASVSAPDAD